MGAGLKTEISIENICLREGWEQATEVARTARQHHGKRAGKFKESLPSCRDGGSPKL